MHSINYWAAAKTVLLLPSKVLLLLRVSHLPLLLHRPKLFDSNSIGYAKVVTNDRLVIVNIEQIKWTLMIESVSLY